jgi:ketosteroid isomerase-like protein
MRDLISASLSLTTLSLAIFTASTLSGAAAYAESESKPDSKANSKKVCHVKCNDPHAACSESEKVIEALQHLTRLISQGDFNDLAQHLDADVTTFDDTSKKLVTGREAVIANLKEKWERAHKRAQNDVVSYTIDSPYAQVKGDTATVTFIARKVIGGPNPATYVSHSTDVFKKEGDRWVAIHYIGSWKKVSG